MHNMSGLDVCYCGLHMQKDQTIVKTYDTAEKAICCLPASN